METLLPFALLCFTSFFTLTNPLGTMPVFLTMTHGMTDKERRAIVRRATIVSFLTLMVFVFAGQLLFKFLAIPMLCGPGAIANAIVLMEDSHTIEMKSVLIGMIALIYFITFLILRASTRLVKVLGETGNNVMMRLMGLILMVIAVECFVSGLRPILVGILKEGMM